MPTLRGLLQSQLEQVRDDLIQMGDMVQQAATLAVEALVDQDVELAQQVIDGDQQINQLRFDIEELCLNMLATQNPTAIDLRTVVAALNIITDLERMGDYAKGIGQIVLRIEPQEMIAPLQKTVHMARIVNSMLDTALTAFVEEDEDAARRLFEMDDEVDHMYRDLFESIIQAMIAREVGVHSGMHLLFAAHNLERIGDRVTNIAERVLFMQTGVMQEYNL